MLIAHAWGVHLAAGLLLMLQPRESIEHVWQGVTSGTTISAGLRVDPRLLRREPAEALSLIIACNVATSTPTLQAVLISENIGFRPAEPMRMSFGPSTYTGPPTLLPVPILPDGHAPQNVRLAPGMVPTVAKRLAVTDGFAMTFIDALGRSRLVRVAVANGAELPKLLSPCTF